MPDAWGTATTTRFLALDVWRDEAVEEVKEAKEVKEVEGAAEVEEVEEAMQV